MAVLALSLVAAAVLGVVCVVGAATVAYRVGRSVTTHECAQLRVTCRELVHARAELARQVDVARERVERLLRDGDTDLVEVQQILTRRTREP